MFWFLQQQLGSKIKDTSLVLMKLYIFICARVQRKKQAYTFSNYTFSNIKTIFALLVTHKEKRQSRMLVHLKKTEFTPAGVQARSPPARSIRKRPVREAKFNLKNYTGWNANS